nr:TRAP transporter fused permease subunit [Thalassobacillus sp. C254]
MKKKHLLLSTLIAIGWVTFHIYTAINGMLPAMQQRIIHLSFALSLSYSLFPLPMKRKELFKRVLNILLPFIPLVLGAYFLFHMPRLDLRIQFVDTLSPLDLFAGFLYLLLLLEISRRIVGKMITYLALVFIVYALAGPLFPGLLGHRGLDFPHLIDLLFYSTDGIFGIPVGVAADYVFYFVIFGAFFYVSGGGQLFNDIAFRLTKRSKGGPAKAAVISSSLMGSVSGSAVANVASTGIFTIPLMKKAGYSKKDSAAIESLASTGGQLMPPIMGAAVFIMAEMIGIPYVELIVAAMIPAFLYYVSLLIIVHLKASKEQLSIVQVKESMDNIIIRLHLLLPLILLVTLIFTGYSLHRAAIWAIGAVIILGWARKPYQLNRHTIIEAINKGAKQAIHVTIPCAIAGIIVGVIGFTGLGLKFTSLITLLSSDIMIIALILTAGGCILLGMGMPTTSAYIMGAILLAQHCKLLVSVLSLPICSCFILQCSL